MKFLRFLLLLAIACSSQELVNPIRIIGVSLQRPVIDSPAYAKVAEKVDAGRRNIRPFGSLYFLNDGINDQYAYRFVVDSLNVHQDRHTYVIHDGRAEKWEYANPGKLYYYGVAVDNFTTPGTEMQVANFLTSAYLLETGAIRYDSAQYMRTTLKSDREFWKRNLISQGWGAQYALAENPYITAAWLPIGFGYLMDASLLALAATVAVKGDRMQDRIGVPLTLLGVSMAFKLGTNGLMIKGNMNTYNRFVKSGYPVPKTSWWNFQDARFGHYMPDSVTIVRAQPTPHLDAATDSLRTDGK